MKVFRSFSIVVSDEPSKIDAVSPADGLACFEVQNDDGSNDSLFVTTIPRICRSQVSRDAHKVSVLIDQVLKAA